MLSLNLELTPWIWNQKGLRNSNTRFGLVAICNFTKIAEVVSVDNMAPAETIRGLKDTFKPMGEPKQVYSDEECSMTSAQMLKFINEAEIKSVQASTHAHTVERFIRTFQDNLFRRLDALKQTTMRLVQAYVYH